jgi:hypothetical protein
MIHLQRGDLQCIDVNNDRKKKQQKTTNPLSKVKGIDEVFHEKKKYIYIKNLTSHTFLPIRYKEQTATQQYENVPTDRKEIQDFGYSVDDLAKRGYAKRR